MNLQSQILSMKQYINDAEQQLTQLQAGRKSSSAKIRHNLMKVKTASHILRRDVITFQKSLPVKSRVKKEAPAPAPAPAPPVEAEDAPVEPIKKPRKARATKEKQPKIE